MDNNLGNSDSNLTALAAQVLKEYNIIPEEISVIQSGSIKTVWKVRTRTGTVCLKRLKQTIDKALFSVNAQLYIKETGGNVPGIFLDKQGEPIVKLNEQLFVVYEWLSGKDLNFGNPNDMALALEGLAKFHVASKGYKAKEGARISSKLGKWPDQYESMKTKLVTWKEAAKSRGRPEDRAYLNWVDPVIEIANQAIGLLKQSKYLELISDTSDVPVLCHQDFGKGNALLTNKGVIVIDLDGVTFDLPSRDLRKIIGKAAENTGKWDIKQILDILNAYTRINPFTDEEKKVLYIDLLFPHWFFGLVKNQYDIGKVLKASEFERMSKLETSKVSVLKGLLMR